LKQTLYNLGTLSLCNDSVVPVPPTTYKQAETYVTHFSCNVNTKYCTRVIHEYLHCLSLNSSLRNPSVVRHNRVGYSWDSVQRFLHCLTKESIPCRKWTQNIIPRHIYIIRYWYFKYIMCAFGFKVCKICANMGTKFFWQKFYIKCKTDFEYGFGYVDRSIDNKYLFLI
jgi:hypothetical protein